ncbi:MAG TPA: hypothetical protein VMT15_12765 [Bryobacteraceae bacterium]|nr:hypothetical protein [Bryobacteraceae bacterium]
MIRRVILVFAVVSSIDAQRAYEKDGKVVYEDASGHRTGLGAGFNSILTSDEKVVFLRGRKFAYGDKFDCSTIATKNWVAKYDPDTGTETKLFDRSIRFYGSNSLPFCIFSQMHISRDGSTLYLRAHTDATGDSIAVVKLSNGSMTFLHGIEDFWMVESGPHIGDLICLERFLNSKAAVVENPIVHRSPEGRKIKVISYEWPLHGAKSVPLLRKYLQDIGGTIHIDGQQLP